MNELDEIQFEKDMIDLLKEKTKANVVGSYPENKPTFPLIVTSLNVEPRQYDISKNVIKEHLRLTIRMWHTSKTNLITMKKQAEKCLLEYGFTRSVPTDIVKDNTNEKFYMLEEFNLTFNNITNRFERSL